MGHLLQAGPPWHPGWRLASHGRSRGPDRSVPSTTEVDPEFPDMWCAALPRDEPLRGQASTHERARSGGTRAFTVDNFPVFDYVRPNAYGIFDSNQATDARCRP